MARGFAGGAGSTTRLTFGGGHEPSKSNVIDYITIASTGDASDFGDLTVARTQHGSASNQLRGVWYAGDDGSISNVIDYVTIASTGNAADFGDAVAAMEKMAGHGDSHGGL